MARRAWWKLPWRDHACPYCKADPGKLCIVQRPHRVGNLGVTATRPHDTRLNLAAVEQHERDAR